MHKIIKTAFWIAIPVLGFLSFYTKSDPDIIPPCPYAYENTSWNDTIESRLDPVMLGSWKRDIPCLLPIDSINVDHHYYRSWPNRFPRDF